MEAARPRSGSGGRAHRAALRPRPRTRFSGERFSKRDSSRPPSARALTSCAHLASRTVRRTSSGMVPRPAFGFLVIRARAALVVRRRTLARSRIRARSRIAAAVPARDTAAPAPALRAVEAFGRFGGVCWNRSSAHGVCGGVSVGIGRTLNNFVHGGVFVSCTVRARSRKTRSRSACE